MAKQIIAAVGVPYCWALICFSIWGIEQSLGPFILGLPPMFLVLFGITAIIDVIDKKKE